MSRKLAPQLAWDATRRPSDNRPPKRNHLFFIYIARLFGWAPFTIKHSYSSSASMSLSNDWLLYSCFLNVLLFSTFFVSIRLFYVAAGRKLTAVVLPIVRGSVMVLSQIACLLKRSDIAFCLQNIQSRSTSPPKTKSIILTFGISVIVMFLVHVVNLVVSDYSPLMTLKGIIARGVLILPIFIAQLAVFMFSYFSNLLTHDLRKMRLDVELVRYSSRKKDLDIVYGFCQRYLKIALFKERLENASSHQILMVVFLLFVHSIGYLHYAVKRDVRRFILISMSAFCFSMLWVIFHFGSLVVAEAEKMAAALSATLTRPGLPQAVRKELRDVAVQLLHLRLRFTACGFFPLDHTQVQAVITAIATYIVTLRQTSNSYVVDDDLATATEAASTALAALRNSTLSCCSCDSCVP